MLPPKSLAAVDKTSNHSRRTCPCDGEPIEDQTSLETKATPRSSWEKIDRPKKNAAGDQTDKGKKHRSSTVRRAPRRLQPSQLTHPSEKTE
ncbi:hypothetical protein F2Q70_00034397 [Brassica cretica]|uniref:Uncharacterized protein n=1 Tax=Brassica cretica TaxID=69181 RepID=A0A8S9JW58_BRACR|nr:hypothetical protein F2Q70_00034397 [Brassica cretica]